MGRSSLTKVAIDLPKDLRFKPVLENIIMIKSSSPALYYQQMKLIYLFIKTLYSQRIILFFSIHFSYMQDREFFFSTLIFHHTRTRTRTRAHTRARTQTHTRTHALPPFRPPARTPARTNARTHTYICVCVCVYLCECVCVCVYEWECACAWLNAMFPG